MPERGEALLRSRRQKLEKLRSDGVDPYPPRYRRTCTNAAAIASFQEEEAQSGQRVNSAPVRLAGRVVSMRVMGKASFMDIRDGSGKVQAYFRRDLLGDAYQLVKGLDLGDFLGVVGPLFRTTTVPLTLNC